MKLAEENRKLRAALKPFAKFAAAWNAAPINGLDNRIYSIHGGEDCPGGACIRLTDCQRALSLLTKVTHDR